MSAQADIRANRSTRVWSFQTQLARLCWGLSLPLFRFSPRPLWAWRVWLLRLFGAQIGRAVHIHPTVRITMPWHLRIDDEAAVGDRAILYALGMIHIEARATVSQYAHLCAGSHDHRDPARPLLRLPIFVGADAWVCADAFVGPDVRIGAGAILGARAVAMRDLPAGQLGVGNPMQVRAKL
ncbi:acetyltransferase [Yoonia sediminilitoris]|uniref:Putative colanic acid biosynthesis acetyltransferase WcaF n=1 Tax=Yoonia sediminilitoris TaxID=1286148 RepID=A0A2T6KBA6_9RHOB|nr:acetyltransferase [Yoonia sediminilitoris]PUB12130.1 putative colanic acid biosynthesis acetyltransferase WcaF [Yoonia sediminilitoris]RCW92957.1 putative colanic acid biosynthesis acetyltransferase WcaF [Yoonia sediminilitoris]